MSKAVSVIKDVMSALEPKVLECPYTGKKVIFTVTKIMFYEDGSIGIAWSCNQGEDCEVRECRYSRAWKRAHKKVQ